MHNPFSSLATTSILVLIGSDVVLCDEGPPLFTIIAPIVAIIILISMCICCWKYCGKRTTAQGVILSPPKESQPTVIVQNNVLPSQPGQTYVPTYPEGHGLPQNVAMMPQLPYSPYPPPCAYAPPQLEPQEQMQSDENPNKSFPSAPPAYS